MICFKKIIYLKFAFASINSMTRGLEDLTFIFAILNNSKLIVDFVDIRQLVSPLRI